MRGLAGARALGARPPAAALGPCRAGAPAVPRRAAARVRAAGGNGAAAAPSGGGAAAAGAEAKAEIFLLRSDGYSCSRETVDADNGLAFEHPTSQQHLLVWKTRPKCVMLLKKLGPELLAELREVAAFCGGEQGLAVLVEAHDRADLAAAGFSPPYLRSWTAEEAGNLHARVDFVVCLGGDGLMLHAADLFGSSIPPVISFKLGSLGFLTCHDYADHRRHLADVIGGCQELSTCKVTNDVDGSSLPGIHVCLRMRLLCEVFREGAAAPVASHEVLNEVVLSRGAAPWLSKIEVYERDTLLTRVQADGIMLATPTGSTAYSVAAGGSMVHPSVHAILFTPICPHSLAFRPVILPDYAVVTLRIAGDARAGALATFDGKHALELRAGDAVRVRLSPHPVPTINNRDQTLDWFSAIERCFNWSDRLEQQGAGARDVAAAPLPRGKAAAAAAAAGAGEAAARAA